MISYLVILVYIAAINGSVRRLVFFILYSSPRDFLIMLCVTNQEHLETLLAEHSAVLVLYGGEFCGVCQALKPQLLRLLAEQFPRVTAVYIDCQQEAAGLCAQQRIMALPVIQVWFEGRRFTEFFKVFSLADISIALARPYALLFE